MKEPTKCVLTLSDEIIKQNAYEQDEIITELILEGTKKIGKEAFRGCKYLKRVIIPDTIEVIEADAFYQCPNLETVILPPNFKKIPKRCFGECSSLTNIDLTNIEVIEKEGFAGCLRLENVNIKNLKVCDEDCFSKTGITQALINIKNIPDGMFWDCPYLESIVFGKDCEVLESNSLGYCDSLKTIFINEGMLAIKEQAIKEVDLLEEIYLPHTLEELDSMNSILPSVKIYYNGTKEEFLKIHGAQNFLKMNKINIKDVGFKKTLEQLIDTGMTFKELNDLLKHSSTSYDLCKGA